MNKTVVLLLILAFLTASFLISAETASSSSEVTENSWVSKAQMQVARSFIGVAVVKDKIYAIGGSTQHGSSPGNLTGGVVGTNEEYNPETDSWTYKESMLTPRQNFAIAVSQNKIYCLGGLLENGTLTNVNEAYNPATDTWETKAPMPTPRSYVKANVADGEVYLIGGDTNGTLNEVYDPATDFWTTKKSAPTSTYAYASAVVDDKVYVIGGSLNQIYDVGNDSWSLGAPQPSRTAYGAAVATLGVNAPKRIYVLGQDFSFSEPPYVNQVYDPAANAWSVGASLPTERRGFGVAVVSDAIYVIGGFTEVFDMFNDYVTVYSTNELYLPFGFGTVPPKVDVVSPESKSYSSNSVPLVFTVNKRTSWLAYSLDRQANTTITENTTLTELSSGNHTVTIYANDTFGNIQASKTISFNIAGQFPATLVATVAGAAAVVVAATVILYAKKRTSRRKTEKFEHQEPD
jgi:N-acetylneuraminic acid mutarotase